MAERIGFVGVGRMGANMARRLAECGYKVTALYDINKKSAQALAKELNAEACATLARVTELSDVVITVVTDDKAMRKIFAAKGDSLLEGAVGRVFINCATVSPEIHVEVEALAKKAKAQSLEAAWRRASLRRGKGPSILCVAARSLLIRA
jgi:3-hydroxyisobutyrate dehydrogenase